MDQIKEYEIRRANLRLLVDQHGGWRTGGQEKLAVKLGVTPGWISQLGTKRRSISEKTARKWEKTLGLAPFWMDQPHPPDTTTQNDAAPDEIQPIAPGNTNDEAGKYTVTGHQPSEVTLFTAKVEQDVMEGRLTKEGLEVLDRMRNELTRETRKD